MTAVELPHWRAGFAAAADVSSGRVRARGILDLFTVDLLCGAIDVLLTAGTREITVDLSEVHEVDRSAARTLGEVQMRITGQGRTLRFVAPGTVLEALLQGDVVP